MSCVAIIDDLRGWHQQDLQRAVVLEARTWLGVRWQHQGRSRTGIDCAGLVVEVARVTHGNTFDLTNYTAQAQDETMLELCAHRMDAAPLVSMRPGDVVVMRFENQRHMGIIGDYPSDPASHAVRVNALFAKKVTYKAITLQSGSSSIRS